MYTTDPLSQFSKIFPTRALSLTGGATYGSGVGDGRLTFLISYIMGVPSIRNKWDNA